MSKAQIGNKGELDSLVMRSIAAFWECERGKESYVARACSSQIVV
jgi:hypothetical protein